MAQLPPRIPNVAPNWSNFGHQRSPSAAAFRVSPATTPAAAAASTPAQPSWVDEFFDFSSAKRGAHRRSASDSVAFLEAPRDRVQEFDRLDDEQLMSMFPDSDVAAPHLVAMSVRGSSTSNASTPSDDNSASEHQQHLQKLAPKSEIEEAQSRCEVELETSTPEPGTELIVDPKRVKRILANRQSAQRSRVRKLQYISELERSVTYLQTEVSALSPRVAFLDHQRSVLTLGNSAIKQRIAALAQDKIFKDAHQEALKKEIERLREVYHEQSLKKMASAVPTTTGADATAEHESSTEELLC